MAFLHPDVHDELKLLSESAKWQGLLIRVLCAGEPATRAEADTLYPAGKRVTGKLTMSTGQMTLGNASPAGRQVVVAQVDATVAAAVSEVPLYHVLYDDTRLLVVSEPLPARGLSLNEEFPLPAWSIRSGVIT